jgi:hypothetical protein
LTKSQIFGENQTLLKPLTRLSSGDGNNKKEITSKPLKMETANGTAFQRNYFIAADKIRNKTAIGQQTRALAFWQ